MKSLFLSTKELGIALKETGWFWLGLFLVFPITVLWFLEPEFAFRPMLETALSMVAAVEELSVVDWMELEVEGSVGVWDVMMKHNSGICHLKIISSWYYFVSFFYTIWLIVKSITKHLNIHMSSKEYLNSN